MENTNHFFQKLKSFCEVNEQFRIAFEVNTLGGDNLTFSFKIINFFYCRSFILGTR